MIKTSYDPDADAFYAYFAHQGAVVASTAEVAPGVIIDLDASGQMIGMEVLNVRLRGAGTTAGAAVIAAE